MRFLTPAYNSKITVRKFSHRQHSQMNCSNRLNSWANLCCPYAGKENLDIFILHESINKRASRKTGREKQKHFWERRDNTGVLSAAGISVINCSISAEFGHKLRQVLQSFCQAAYPHCVHPFGSPCGEAPGSWAPAPSAAGGFPGVLGSCSTTKGTGLPAGTGGLWPSLSTVSELGELGGNSVALAHREV